MLASPQLTRKAHAYPCSLVSRSYFAATLAAEIAAAKAEGRFSEGVSDLSGSSITVKGQPKVRGRRPHSGSGADRARAAAPNAVGYSLAIQEWERPAL
jgi:hypothetical protein